MKSVTSGLDFTSVILLAHSKHSELSDAEAASGFRRLHRIVESLPLTTDEFCFAHNWLCSAEKLWESGDRHAARYQVNQVTKKLML
jgi:hypothetical protein